MTYTVVSGDSLSRIAQRYGTTVQALVNANASRYPSLRTNSGYLAIGWQLTIPGAGVFDINAVQQQAATLNQQLLQALQNGQSNSGSFPGNYVYAGDRIEWNAMLVSPYDPSALVTFGVSIVGSFISDGYYNSRLPAFRGKLASYQSVESTIEYKTHLGYTAYYLVVRATTTIDRNSIEDIRGDFTRYANDAGMPTVSAADTSKNSIRVIEAGARRNSIGNGQGSPLSPGGINSQDKSNGGDKPTEKGIFDSIAEALTKALGTTITAGTVTSIVVGGFLVMWLTRD